MPWKETCVMDERMKFIGRLLSGEKMASLCREYGISRVTGYKIWSRYQEFGSVALFDQSRAPHKHPNQTPFEVERLIVRLKKEKSHWGAPKIRELISNRYSSIKLPATSTVHEILDRHDLVKKRKRRNKYRAMATYLSSPEKANDLWCVDFKGEFKLLSKDYCYPLTISDYATRFLINCESLRSTQEATAFRTFEETFREHGLPAAIRSDNGIPFACGNAVWGLTRLSVWWICLGIKLERIEPGNPQQNGRHERMHRTLKAEATRPPGSNFLKQQEKFYGFMQEYNFERPHQALGMKRPGDLYQKSPRPYQGLPDITYPGYDKTILVTHCGRICMNRLKIHISKALANQPVGIRLVDNGIWEVSFKDYDLGYFDEESKKFAPRQDPFGFNLEKKL
jgi:transposase InsO family protein